MGITYSCLFGDATVTRRTVGCQVMIQRVRRVPAHIVARWARRDRRLPVTATLTPDRLDSKKFIRTNHLEERS